MFLAIHPILDLQGLIWYLLLLYVRKRKKKSEEYLALFLKFFGWFKIKKEKQQNSIFKEIKLKF